MCLESDYWLNNIYYNISASRKSYALCINNHDEKRDKCNSVAAVECAVKDIFHNCHFDEE